MFSALIWSTARLKYCLINSPLQHKLHTIAYFWGEWGLALIQIIWRCTVVHTFSRGIDFVLLIRSGHLKFAMLLDLCKGLSIPELSHRNSSKWPRVDRRKHRASWSYGQDICQALFRTADDFTHTGYSLLTMLVLLLDLCCYIWCYMLLLFPLFWWLSLSLWRVWLFDGYLTVTWFSSLSPPRHLVWYSNHWLSDFNRGVRL